MPTGPKGEKRRADVDERIALLAADAKSLVAVGAEGKIWVFSGEDGALQRAVTLAGGPFEPKAVALDGDDMLLTAGKISGETGAVLVVDG